MESSYFDDTTSFNDTVDNADIIDVEDGSADIVDVATATVIDGGADIVDVDVVIGGAPSNPHDIEKPPVLPSVLSDIVTVSECRFANTDADKQNGVCRDSSQIHNMKQFLKEKEIHVDTASPEQVVDKMMEVLECETEYCIYKKPEYADFIGQHKMEKIADEIFKPKGPAIDFGLLSNINIDSVLEQFADRYPERHFLHINYQMRDFEKIGTELATLDLAASFARGIKTFGVVLNTDYHTGRGIHWFALFGENYADHIDLEYFNSSGKPPLKEVQIWLGKTAEYLEAKLKKPVNIIQVVSHVLQKDDHSCGVWSIFYIWARLLGIEHTWFTAQNVNDSVMQWLRLNLFRH